MKRTSSVPLRRLRASKILDELRNRVIEGVVDRILAEWSNPQNQEGGLAAEVMERLIERVLDELQYKSYPRP